MAIKGLVYFFYSPFQGMIYWLYRLLSAGKGADMNYYNASGQMDLSDRIAIETGICIGESFKKIAKRLRRHPSTIAHEVKENRTFIIFKFTPICHIMIFLAIILVCLMHIRDQISAIITAHTNVK